MTSRLSVITGRLIALGVAGGRVSPYPVPPRAVFPYVTVRELPTKDLESHSGYSGLTMSVIQVDVWSEDYEEADTIRQAAKTGIRGCIGSGTDPRVQAINHQNDTELLNSETSKHQLITRYIVWFETAPTA